MIIHRTGKKAWTNRHETFTQAIDNLYDLGNRNTGSELADYNDATAGIQGLIREAIDTGKGLRALGGEWSWTRIAATDGVILNTKPLNLSFRINSGNVSPAYARTPDDLYFAQCGVSVKELNDRLGNRGRSLKTTGASNGQTIAGALSTGTHGSAIDVGAIPEYVVGLHLIAGPTKHIWLERETYPVVSGAFADRLQTSLVRSDDLFNAALVSFGSFGFIHGVMMETDPLFLYEGYRVKLPADDKLFHLMQTLDFTGSLLPHGEERPYHFMAAINQYDPKRQAVISAYYKRPYVAGYPPFPPAKPGLGPGDDGPAFIGHLTDVVPSLIPAAINRLFDTNYPAFDKLIGTHNEFFPNTEIFGKVLSTAIGLPLTEVKRVTDIVLQLNKSHGPFGGVLSYRFVKGSAATLGFTRFDPTCILELDGLYSAAAKQFYRVVWEALNREGIPHTFHWGKEFDAGEADIRSMYPAAALNSWLAARHAILENEATEDVFTNALLRQWGLDKKLRVA